MVLISFNNDLKMSAPYFVGSGSPVIAYSPRYAAGYSALPGLEIRDRAGITGEIISL